MMLGFLLARAGVDVVVLEKHADFFRDFRGDTIHPSTLDVIWELGLLEQFLKLPHNQERLLSAVIGDETIPIADFSHVRARCKFLMFMPQWDFLDFLALHARSYPGFHLMMNAEAQHLTFEGGRVTGLTAWTPTGMLHVQADLVVAADGRTSTCRRRAGLQAKDLGAPIDVLWFRLSRVESDPPQSFGRITGGQILVSINRKTYWQCGLVIVKGAFDGIRARGLEAFRNRIATTAPYLADRSREIASWEDVKLLTVTVNRLEQWYCDGLLCIGDAAHAMSPIGGVGINLAIQDAVAAANILADPLYDKKVTAQDLAGVQARRLFPTRVTQTAQVQIQKRVISRVLQGSGNIKTPFIMKLFQRFPVLGRVPAHLVGVGVRPEHIKTPRRGPQPLRGTMSLRS